MARLIGFIISETVRITDTSANLVKGRNLLFTTTDPLIYWKLIYLCVTFWVIFAGFPYHVVHSIGNGVLLLLCSCVKRADSQSLSDFLYFSVGVSVERMIDGSYILQMLWLPNFSLVHSDCYFSVVSRQRDNDLILVLTLLWFLFPIWEKALLRSPLT